MFKIKQFNWIPALFIIIYHIFLLVALPIYFYHYLPSAGIWIFSFVLLYLTGLSITGGYHRYYAHRSYKAHPIVEFFLLFFSSMAGQGSALRWSFDHRLHHAHVDTDDDPYSIKKGFWYAHILWILEKPPEIDFKVVPDLKRNSWVMFQDRWYLSCIVLTNFLGWAFVGWVCNDYLAAFLIATFFRMFALHHFTWFINSLAHTWGDKPFDKEQTAVDNYFLALLTFGEGYHNYHHTFANDYRNGIRWFHYDPTKWLIWSLHCLGLVDGLKRTDPMAVQKRLVIERKNLLLERLRGEWLQKSEEWASQVNETADRLIQLLSSLNQLKDAYIQNKKGVNVSKEILLQLKNELKSTKRRVHAEWQHWKKLSQEIMQLESPLNT